MKCAARYATLTCMHRIRADVVGARRATVVVVCLGACALVLGVTQVPAAQTGTRMPGTEHRLAACRVPRLVGLSLSIARDRSRRAGCTLRVRESSRPQDVSREPKRLASDQVIARQSPHEGSAAHAVTVWLRQMCVQSADPGPPTGEPFATRGSTELVTGLFLEGGPLRRAVRCRHGIPSPGMVNVIEPTTGKTVASQTVLSGQLARFPLRPGTYTIQGAIATAFVNDQRLNTLPRTVTIAAGTVVHQDVVANIR
jgi:hypothetical protein